MVIIKNARENITSRFISFSDEFFLFQCVAGPFIYFIYPALNGKYAYA